MNSYGMDSFSYRKLIMNTIFKIEERKYKLPINYNNYVDGRFLKSNIGNQDSVE